MHEVLVLPVTCLSQQPQRDRGPVFFCVSTDACVVCPAVCDIGFYTETGRPVEWQTRRHLLALGSPSNPGCWACNEGTTTAGRQTAGDNSTQACTVCAVGWWSSTGQTVDGACNECNDDGDYEFEGLTTAAAGTAGADAPAACTGAAHVVIHTRFRKGLNSHPSPCKSAALSFCSCCGLRLQFASAGGNQEPLLARVSAALSSCSVWFFCFPAVCIGGWEQGETAGTCVRCAQGSYSKTGGTCLPCPEGKSTDGIAKAGDTATEACTGARQSVDADCCARVFPDTCVHTKASV
jgi:hypothetical protein